jgi:F-type H+-transporting ATPase subunit c
MSKKVFLTLTKLSGFALMLLVPLVAFAQEDVLLKQAQYDTNKWIAIAAGLGMALASFGGAISQSRAASAALDGIARNPGASDKIFTPMLLGLALIESLVLFTFVIAFLLYNTIKF